jgi:hypothetical protein
VNTERLVDLLSSNLEPVGCVRFGKTQLLAMLTGSAAALILMLTTVGPRADLDLTAHLGWTAVNVIGTATPLLFRSMRSVSAKRSQAGLRRNSHNDRAAEIAVIAFKPTEFKVKVEINLTIPNRPDSL